MAKRIAVLVRDRQGEALRMSVGLTLMDDIVEVFVLDRKLDDNEKNNLNIETIEMLELNLYTNCKDNEEMEFLSNSEIAQKLLKCDHILPY